MTWLTRYAIAAAAALAVMASWSAWMQSKGVQLERARVERIGKKLDAKAKIARRKVEKATQSEIQIELRRYCADCKP